MIGYLRGIVESVSEDNVVLDVRDVGYNVKISADTASRLPGAGEEVKLYTYTMVKEDAFLLYGFLSRDELELFKLCITVNGVGPKAAQAILAVMDTDSLRFAILSGDVKAISRAPGVGKKLAERLVLELKGRVSAEDTLIGRTESVGYAGGAEADTTQKREAVEALTALGYGAAESLKAVNAIEGIEDMDAGAILKAALKKM